MSIMDELKKLTRPYDDDSDLIDDDMDMDEGVNEPVYTRPNVNPQPQPQPAAAPVENPLNMGGMGNMGNMGNMGAMGGTAAPVNEAPRTNMGNVNPINMGFAQDVAKYRVVLVQPEKYDNAKAIGANLRKGNALILNCENTNPEVARRVIDFIQGCAFALDGEISKAANNVYIVTPRTVGVDEAEFEADDEA